MLGKEYYKEWYAYSANKHVKKAATMFLTLTMYRTMLKCVPYVCTVLYSLHARYARNEIQGLSAISSAKHVNSPLNIKGLCGTFEA